MSSFIRSICSAVVSSVHQSCFWLRKLSLSEKTRSSGAAIAREAIPKYFKSFIFFVLLLLSWLLINSPILLGIYTIALALESLRMKGWKSRSHGLKFSSRAESSISHQMIYHLSQFYNIFRYRGAFRLMIMVKLHSLEYVCGNLFELRCHLLKWTYDNWFKPLP